ncbi:prolyl oligopeptidase family serine peptidase [Curtobacterium pusillum]|uniref:prolyl oligopeptidase family serine peptidase n=1 Tax=Curtobacterium pusillum TaxID=69373 RepID=UPI0011A24981|nr:prolyl oligopeptidase family serine peptidase [Curtobacterium pusillum]
MSTKTFISFALPTALVLATAAPASAHGLGATAPTADDGIPRGAVVSAVPLAADWVPANAATSTRIEYLTSDVHGRAALSSGLVYTPEGSPPPGGWPVVSWAHGTQGIADACAPSVSGPYDRDRDVAYLEHWLGRGYAIAASDYAGLGTAGEHAYLDAASVAHNVVDMVTAAHNTTDRTPTPDDDLASAWVSVGHSQGAGAAVAAGRWATSFGGPDLAFRGTVGTGTPARIAESILPLGPGNPAEPVDPHVTAYVTYMLNGIRLVAPQLDAVLGETGREALRLGREQCLAELSASLEDVPLGSFFEQPLASDPSLVTAVRSYLAMPESGFDRPVLLAHGTADVDVPYAVTAAWAADLVEAGEPVRFRSLPGVSHADTIAAALEDTTAFVDAALGHQ